MPHQQRQSPNPTRSSHRIAISSKHNIRSHGTTIKSSLHHLLRFQDTSLSPTWLFSLPTSHLQNRHSPPPLPNHTPVQL